MASGRKREHNGGVPCQAPCKVCKRRKQKTKSARNVRAREKQERLDLEVKQEQLKAENEGLMTLIPKLAANHKYFEHLVKALKEIKQNTSPKDEHQPPTSGAPPPSAQPPSQPPPQPPAPAPAPSPHTQETNERRGHYTQGNQTPTIDASLLGSILNTCGEIAGDSITTHIAMDWNQIPLEPSQFPPGPNHIAAEPKQMPDKPRQIPVEPNPMPASPYHISATPSQSPVEPKHMSEQPRQIPAGINQIERGPTQMPVEHMQMPEKPNQIPVRPNQMAVEPNQILLESHQIPKDPNQVPMKLHQIPARPEQMPEKPRQTPREFEQMLGEGDYWEPISKRLPAGKSDIDFPVKLSVPQVSTTAGAFLDPMGTRKVPTFLYDVTMTPETSVMAASMAGPSASHGTDLDGFLDSVTVQSLMNNNGVNKDYAHNTLWDLLDTDFRAPIPSGDCAENATEDGGFWLPTAAKPT
ncbi:hepatocyte growth factor-regulated tyrosine kinase substrate-like isoform X2 [Littorina saxatilis]